MKKVYSDEFKKAVIDDYYNSTCGIRVIARKYDLGSKNYITRWEAYLKDKGILDADASKPVKAAGRSKDVLVFNDDRTHREKQYEAEIEALKARVSYLESLDSLQPFLKKNKD